MPSYSKKHNIILFTRNELVDLFETSKKYEMIAQMLKDNISFYDLKKDFRIMDQFTSSIAKKIANSRDEHEIIFALYSLSYFYNDGVNIGFKMKRDFNPNKQPINCLNDLIVLREVDTDVDFVIGTGDGFRFFQLKRYKGELKTDGIISFIKQTVSKYGSLGSTNLLIIIQPREPFATADFDLCKIHNEIKSLSYDFVGEILLKWNQMNKNSIILQIYPNFKKMIIPFMLPSERK